MKSRLPYFNLKLFLTLFLFLPLFLFLIARIISAQGACYTGSRCTYDPFYEWVTTNPRIECGDGSARIVWSECGLDTCGRTFTYTWDGIVSVEGSRQGWGGTHYGDWCFEGVCQSESFTWDQYKSATFQIEFRVDSTCCMQSISDIPITTCSARPTPTPVLNTCPYGTDFSSCIWSFNSCPAGETKINNCSFCSVAGTSCCCAPEPTSGPCTYECIFAPGGCQFLSPACTPRSGTCSGAGMSCCECPSGPTATPGGPTPTSPPPSGRWFQTYVGDVHSQGSITSNVPLGQYFCKKDSSIGDSGLVSYKNLSSNFGSGGVSETNNSWNVDSADWPREDNKYGYDYYKNKFSSPASFGNTLQGVACNTVNGIYTVTGDLTVGSTCRIDGGRKVVFLVSRNLNVNNKMEVGNDSFLAFIVSGDIQIANNRRGNLSNPDVQGVYIADGQIRTGSGSNQLYAGGIFVGWGGFSLQRTGGTSDPREVFIYRPDLLVNMPKEMKEEKFVWREVAP